jgi:hypothetical protein
MHSNSAANRRGFSRPIVLTAAETKRVAGGSVHKNDKAGGGNPNMYGPPGGDPANPNPPGNDGDPPPFAGP